MDFKPILRVMVCSDIHFGESEMYPDRFEYAGQERDAFEKCVGFAYDFAGSCDSYKELDAFVAVGDFVTSGTEREMQSFKESLDKVLKKGTEIMLPMASHEYFAEGVEAATEKLKRIFGKDPIERKEIKGFQFIAASTDARCQTGAAKQEQIKTELKRARDFDPKKPIFFFFHPQFQGTVYGCNVLWRTPAILQSVMNYPQVIAFSGHSHAPLGDPRTVHQKYFTSFGTGAIIGVMNCNADRLNPRLKNAGTPQFLMVEADAQNRVRVTALDGKGGKPVYQPWLIENCSDPDSFIYTDDRYFSAKKPIFPENAGLCASYGDGRLSVSVSQASDGEDRVPGYRFAVKDKDGLTLSQFGICSGYYLYDLPEKACYTVDINLKSGNYCVECYAQSFFDKESDCLKTTFTVE